MNYPSESPDRTLWRATDTTRHHRENLWNYKGRGFYHFTLNVEGRYPLFGRLEGDSAEEAHIVLSAFGEGVGAVVSWHPDASGAAGMHHSGARPVCHARSPAWGVACGGTDA